MREDKRYYVYILAKEKNGTLYVGITNNLERRIWEHKNNLVKGFTEKYKIHNLVYYEVYGEIGMALYREKLIKRWPRNWKMNVIEKENPYWKDLYESIG